MGDYKKLAVWEKTHQLTLAIYKVTADFPKEELYGLVSQIRRAAASIPTNIVEGSGRGTDGELVRFLRIAMGSAQEVEYQLLLSYDLHFINESQYTELNTQIAEIQRMLSGLMRNLKANDS